MCAMYLNGADFGERRAHMFDSEIAGLILIKFNIRDSYKIQRVIVYVSYPCIL